MAGPSKFGVENCFVFGILTYVLLEQAVKKFTLVTSETLVLVFSPVFSLLPSCERQIGLLNAGLLIPTHLPVQVMNL